MRRHLPLVLLGLALAVTFFLYRAGLAGGFVFDDGPNILWNDTVFIKDLDFESLRQAALSSSSGPIRRPISMVTLALNAFATGSNPYYFKLTNVFIHLVNGVSVFVFIGTLLGIYRRKVKPELSEAHIAWVSAAVAFIWLIHPLNLTSVLYVVQRMTSLAALFTLWALILYLRGRYLQCEGRGGMAHILTAVFVFTPLAILSKETGLLVPVYMLVLEVTLFNFSATTRYGRRFVIGFFGLTVMVPAIALLVVLVFAPDWLLGAYKLRDFTPAERLLTQARVLWFYLGLIVVPAPQAFGLFHDDIPYSRGLLDPISTLPAVIGAIALVCMAVLARKRAPILSLGLLFFFAGHLLESTIFPLEIAHEHRNYLPMLGIVLPGVYALGYPLVLPDSLRIRWAGLAALSMLFAYITAQQASDWGNVYSLYKSLVDRHPNSARANSTMGTVYANLPEDDPDDPDHYYRLARQQYEKATRLQKNDTDALGALIRFSSARGKPGTSTVCCQQQ